MDQNTYPPSTLIRAPLIAAGILMGAGMGGFVDGIVLHQILQWHNMLSARTPPNNLERVDTCGTFAYCVVTNYQIGNGPFFARY